MGLLEGHSVLVVDDDPSIRELLEDFLKTNGAVALTADDGRRALQCLEKGEVDILLTDLKMPGLDGLTLLEKTNEMVTSPIPIVFTGYGSIDSAVQAMRLGAFDYITKPLRLEELRLVLEKALVFRRLHRENIQLRQQLHEKYRFENVVGQSDPMLEVLSLVHQVADTDSTVLIYGESGTGKELIARALHFNSDRGARPMVVVNCSAIPQDLLESELFGHEQGAFTGAVRARTGKFEMANGGSILLDEIGDMSLNLQGKLLRVLQEREIDRLGSGRPIKVDVRIIASTHRNLEECIRQGTFREDLYYRLNVIPIHLPPLRDRQADIPLMVRHFLDRFNRTKGKAVQGFSPGAMERLIQYPWPGNVRELEHLVERMVILQGEGIIDVEDLPEPYVEPYPRKSAPEMRLPEGGMCLPDCMREMERSLIVQALERSGWVKKRAAQYLDINRTTLVEKMRKLGLLDTDSRG